MIRAAPASSERRLLVLPPTRKDGEMTLAVAARAGIDCSLCTDLEELTRELNRGAGAILLAEESLTEDGYASLSELIARQPPWSDLPVLILTYHGADSAAAQQAQELLGNVTLLERPTRMGTVLSAVRTALRARERQYQIRANLVERERGAQFLIEADRRKDEFLATLAHELRNPLAPITNSIHILRIEASHHPSMRPLCEMLERQVHHMVRLVDDLMEISRITRGLLELRMTATDLVGVIQSAVETSRPLIDASGHTLTVNLPPEPLTVMADPVRLAQVFANLLNNSAKYTDRAGSIWLTCYREDGSVLISVRDNGLGIAPDMLPRVFDLFTQADRSGSRAQSGLGIGLTLVKSLVGMHGGTVEARSPGLGMGSEFTVRLPLVVATNTDGAITIDTSQSTLPGLRVLVVDDSRDGAESLAMLLQHLGAEARVVNDGAAALAALAEYTPDAIILDIGMPGMNGYEVARRIRLNPRLSNLALIALTGWGQQADRSRSSAAGFDHHLIKPADIDALQGLLMALTPR